MFLMFYLVFFFRESTWQRLYKSTFILSFQSPSRNYIWLFTSFTIVYIKWKQNQTYLANYTPTKFIFHQVLHKTVWYFLVLFRAIHYQLLHKKDFPVRTSLVNVNKYAVCSYLLKKFLMENFNFWGMNRSTIS